MAGQTDRNALEVAQAFQRLTSVGIGTAIAANVTQLSMSVVAQTTRRVTDLTTLLPVTTFGAVLVDGYAASGDGFAGWYFWNAGDTRAADGVLVIQVGTVGTGRWNRGESSIRGSVALVAGVATISTGLVVTASTMVFVTRLLAGGTLANTVQYAAPSALMVVGGPGVGAVTIKAMGSDGATVNTLDTSTVGYLVVG
jgi:hypothetical protein